jgi:alpha-tubulin suppressor-like RCC1 family protein
MSLVAFGANEKGQLGLGDNNIRKDILSKIDVPLREIVSGGFHNIAIGENDVVYVWGYNYLYQLGLGDNTDRTIPHVLEGYKAKKVGAGQVHSVILTRMRLFKNSQH